MYCSQCGTKLNSPGTVCERCAAAVANPEPAAEPMLIRANLLRMRGRWDQAAEQCAEVLRLDPSNATAHSLLGDIYQDQGRPDQARHWYQLALELNPASVGDRAKVSRAEEALEARSQRAEWEAIIEGRSQPVATSLLVRESLQRVGALAGVALCGIVVVMAMLVSATERNAINGDSDQPVSIFSRPKPATIVMDTVRERALLKGVNEAVRGAAGQAVRVELDPRAQEANLRVFVPRKLREELTTREFRSALMREAYRLARAVHKEDGSLKRIQVTVIGPVPALGGGSESVILFIGELTADNLVVDADAVTPDELRKFFGEVSPVLWAPELISPT
ncbi:MAG: tetratricopeptide repeat protein [Actinomycetota bacterium]